jgi:peptidoglycan/LPS O-acetylase OafA/YrhL
MLQRTPERAGIGFRADVEGLRGVAVLAVLAYHAGIPGLAGGFVGVDVFFVISGYLITRLLLAELDRSGRVSLAGFYARRARRILPAAAVVLAATLAAALLVPPLRRLDIAYDSLAAALQAGNWWFAAQQVDYLAASRDPSPLLHYWSLAVEEQFYLVWAPLLALLPRRAIVPAVASVTASSLALSLWWTGVSAPLAYLASPSRAWEFGVGALLALAAVQGRRPSLGWAGLAAIVGAAAWFGPQTAFPGTAALVPVAGAALVIAGSAPVLGRAWPRLAGRLSYSWYLWHWPVLVVGETLAGDHGWPLRLALVLVSAAPAWMTMRFVEEPIRRSAGLSAEPRRGLAVGVTAIVVPVAAALALGSGAVAAMGTGTLRPTAADARADYPPDPGCEIPLTATVSPPCRFGSGHDRVVLLGDSHAGQWFSAARHVAERRGAVLEVLVKPGCPLAEVTVRDPRLGREYHECGQWRDNALRRLADGPPPRLVLVASLSRYGVPPAEMARGWSATLQRLTRLSTPVVYLRDTPMPGRDVPACLSGADGDWAQCAAPRPAALGSDPVAEHRWPGVEVVDLTTSTLCPPGPSCPAVLDGMVLYRDDSHLTDTAARLLAPRLDDELRGLGH